MDPSSALSGIKDSIVLIMKEINALKMLQHINVNFLTSYTQAIFNLETSVTRLSSIFSYNSPISDQVKLQVSCIDIISKHVLKFQQEIIKYREWADIVEKGKWYQKCSICCNPPSKVQANLQTTFDECYKSMKDVGDFETQLLGSAIRIKHPVLQQAWLFAGLQDINATELENHVLQEALFCMIRTELGSIENKEFCLQMIAEFINKIDGNCGSPPNGKLSINELNEVTVNPEDTSVKSLLGFKKQPTSVMECIKLDGCSLSVSPAVIDHTTKLEFPKSDGCYGSDFNNKCVLSFKVNIDRQNIVLSALKFLLVANDQGWGGTKHAQIRYSINEGRPIPWINIDRTSFPDNKYEAFIQPKDVTFGDTVHIWLYCPGWNGWKCKLMNIECFAVIQLEN